MQLITVKIRKTKSDRVHGVAGCSRLRKMTSTDLWRTKNAPIWADFNLLLQKELTTKVYNTKHSSTDLSVLHERRRCVCTYARVQKRRENEVMRAPNQRMNERVFYQYWNNALSWLFNRRMMTKLCAYKTGVHYFTEITKIEVAVTFSHYETS